MVKIGALIGALFTTIGGIFLIIAMAKVSSSSASWDGYLGAISLVGGNANGLGVASTILYYFGIIIVLGSGFVFVKGKLFLKIGSGILFIGIMMVMIAWLIGAVFEPLYNIGGIIMFLGVLLYFVGCIQFRKHNIVTICTGFLLFLSVLVSQLVVGNILMAISGADDTIMEIHFITLISQIIIFILHSWIFGLSKKRVEYSDKVEDTLSVEKGQAFASYVPQDMNKKKKKGKPSEDDEITFTF